MPKPPPPHLDQTARARGLTKAIELRRARAAIKEGLARGTISPRFILLTSQQPPQSGILVYDFLRSLPGIGDTGADRIMTNFGFKRSKRLGGIGTVQRENLGKFLGMEHITTPKRLHVLAGPTAVGKGTVATYIQQHYPQIMISVSATTRAPRTGEQEGVNYFFVDDDEFDRMVANDELLEWATVHNSHRYGTPRAPIDRALAEGKDVLLEIDLQGARQIRAAMPQAQLIFLSPPSWDELVRRLIGRGTETPEQQERRLRTAKVELAAIDEFDASVVNVDVPTAAAEVVHLMGINE